MATASPAAPSALAIRLPKPAQRDQLLERYRDHLIRERGLAAPTVAGYQTVARQFLAHLATSDGYSLSNLDGSVVTQFVIQTAQRRCIGSTKHVVTGLRSLMKEKERLELELDKARRVNEIQGKLSALLEGLAAESANADSERT